MLEIIPVDVGAKVITQFQIKELGHVLQKLDDAWIYNDCGEYSLSKTEISAAIDDLNWVINEVA